MRWGKLGLCNIGSILDMVSATTFLKSVGCTNIYLVSLMSSSGRNLALLTGSKLGQVAVVITLPVVGTFVSIVEILVQDRVYVPSTIRLTSCGRKPWTLQTQPLGLRTHRGHRGHLGRPSQARSQSFGGSHG